MSDNSETFLLILGIVFMIVDFGLFCCSVVGNAIVIYVISRDKKLKSKSNYLILSVAVGDFLIGLVGIPLGVTAVSLALIPKYLQSLFTFVQLLLISLGLDWSSTWLSSLPAAELLFARRVCSVDVFLVGSVCRQILGCVLPRHLSR